MNLLISFYSLFREVGDSGILPNRLSLQAEMTAEGVLKCTPSWLLSSLVWQKKKKKRKEGRKPCKIISNYKYYKTLYKTLLSITVSEGACLIPTSLIYGLCLRKLHERKMHNGWKRLLESTSRVSVHNLLWSAWTKFKNIVALSVTTVWPWEQLAMHR